MRKRGWKITDIIKFGRNPNRNTRNGENAVTAWNYKES
jgi:hypothetical protein